MLQSFETTETTGMGAMGTIGKKTAVAISVTAALLTAAACGDEKETPSSKPWSRDRLSSAVLVPGDVPGYKIRVESGADSKGLARSDKKSCQPIVNAMDPKDSAHDKRFVVRRLVKDLEDSQKPMADYLLVLSSVESQSAAEQTVKDLKKAISACGSGFKVGSSGLMSKIRRVTAQKSSLGNEGVEFSVEYQSRIKRRYVVTQQGASLATILAQHASLLRFASVPWQIVDAQRQKLEKAAAK
ncbi:hypothetical protein [Streptomyces lasiicapitis]|uniref:hypothetical protein n=1 Tax=Streptomyces lasiicapitis TaxID=1923961 RepID=UPI0036591699